MLDKVAVIATKNPGTQITILGNRNSRESADLAMNRALAIKAKFVREYHLDYKTVYADVGTEGNRTAQIYVQLP